MIFGGIFDFDLRKEELDEVNRELEQPDIWNDQARAQQLGKERARLEAIVLTIVNLDNGLSDATELLEMSVEENDEEGVQSVADDLDVMQKHIEALEFRRMFSGEMDHANAFLDIQSGSGGTEAQDWAEMILRMYLRWGEAHGFKVELIEATSGDVAGIKGATIRFEGDYAYGWLRTETGVHRLVRKSPFDSGSRRHTSFAAVFVSPEVD
ncbi:Peptide chain release factor 2 @ programmed frameshift-containing, partial [hydrothermal vent metagenome]